MFSFLRRFFENKDRLFLSILSFLLALNSLFFIALVVEQVGFFAFFPVKVSYLIYFLLFVLFFLFFFLKKEFFSRYFWRRSFLVLAPSVLVLLFGFSQSIKFNILFKLGVGGYFVALGFFLIFEYKKYEKISDFWKKKSEEKEKAGRAVLAKIILLIVIFLNFSFGFYHLSKFAAVDEALWTNGRISKYWNNILEREFEKTMVSDKPGITIAFLTGPALLFVDPDDYERHDNYGRKFEPPKDVKDMNLAFRLPILIFCSLSLFLFYFFLKPLFGETTSLLSVIFIGLSPILLGISTIVNPDSILWIFVSLSLLAYLNYLKKQSDGWLYLAGIFLGFSILTKYVANILYIFFLGMIFWDFIVNDDRYKKIDTKKLFKKRFLDYLILIFVSLVIFYLFLPKAWVEAEAFFQATLFSQAFEKIWFFFVGLIIFIGMDLIFLKNKISMFFVEKLAKYKKTFIFLIVFLFIFLLVFSILNTWLGMYWFDLEEILSSPKSAYLTSGILGMSLTNLYSLVFGVSPWAILGVIFFILFVLKDKKRQGFFEGISLILFIQIYHLASSLSNVIATVRYQIILYPFFFIVASLGFGFLLKKIERKKTVKILFFSAFLISVSVFSLNFIRPFYFSYANSLLPKKYVLNLKDMGDGSYEAAAFLNSLPNAEEIEIWTDKRGVCMFFVGTCRSGIGIEKGEFNIDYFVVSSGRKSRTTTMTMARWDGGNKDLIRLDKFYDEKNPFWKLEIGKRPNNFVKIIKSNRFNLL